MAAQRGRTICTPFPGRISGMADQCVNCGFQNPPGMRFCGNWALFFGRKSARRTLPAGTAARSLRWYCPMLPSRSPASARSGFAKKSGNLLSCSTAVPWALSRFPRELPAFRTMGRRPKRSSAPPMPRCFAQSEPAAIVSWLRSPPILLRTSRKSIDVGLGLGDPGREDERRLPALRRLSPNACIP